MPSCFCTGACRDHPCGRCPNIGLGQSMTLSAAVGGCACGSPSCKYCAPQYPAPSGWSRIPAGGWLCPKCDFSYGPSTPECYRCNGIPAAVMPTMGMID